MTDIITALSAMGDKTALAALIIALFSASLGMVSYVTKSLLAFRKERREDHKLYRSAVIRFYNDIIIWRADYSTTYTDAKFDEMALEIAHGGKDFKFSVPASDQSDLDEIMRFIHRMTITEARLIRSFILYSKLLTSILHILRTDLATFEPDRKMKALSAFREMSKFVFQLSSAVADSLTRNRFLRESDDTLGKILKDREKIQEDTQIFLEKKLALLKPPERGFEDL